MPLILIKEPQQETKLAVWEIAEEEAFFQQKASVQREIAHPQKRLQHLAGRYLLKELFPDFPAHEIAVAPTRRPFLPGDPFHFSISHCANLAAVVVSRDKRVGVDVEKITEKTVKLKGKFLDTDALMHFDEWVKKAAALPLFHGDPEALCATLVWSAKEAMFKWYGLGNVDFRKQMVIKTIVFQSGNQVEFEAVFMLPEPVPLTLNGLVFEQEVVVWVIT
ncbi:MAG: 4'-phosphopantetheinyl transferase family protein [Chitinophagaceae bacterium]